MLSQIIIDSFGSSCIPSYCGAISFCISSRPYLIFTHVYLGGYCSVREKVLCPSVHVAMYACISNLFEDTLSPDFVIGFFLINKDGNRVRELAKLFVWFSINKLSLNF